jgi:hypothetical protein
MTTAPDTTTAPAPGNVTNLRATRKEQAAKKPAKSPAPKPEPKVAEPKVAKPATVKPGQLSDAIVSAVWETLSLDAVRQFLPAGLNATDEEITKRIDHHMKYVSPARYNEGKRVTA